MDGNEARDHAGRGAVAGPLLRLVAVLADIARTASTAASNGGEAARTRDRDRSGKSEG